MRKLQDEMGGYFMTTIHLRPMSCFCDQAKNPEKEGSAADKRR